VSNDKMSITRRGTFLLEAATLFGCGIVAGFTYYITKVELPGRKDMDIEYQLKNYHQLFPRAAGFMKPFGMLLTAMIGGTIYQTKKPLWWLPMTMFGALGPFTAIAIQPTNNKLMGTDLADAAKVKKEVADWGRLHNIRTYMSLLGFAGAVVAAIGI